jgi:hypothetical protein
MSCKPRKLSLVVLIAALAVTIIVVVLPYYTRSRVTSAANSCVNNLRQIDGAKQQWMLENGKTTNDTPSWADLRPYLGRGSDVRIPECPEGGTYTFGRVAENPKCSIGRLSHKLP